jgi:hypothetical protein
MPLRLSGYIDLPANEGKGGFDHADVHVASDRLYVAHTSNNAVDVIDCASERYVESVTGLRSVAGALVSETRGLAARSAWRRCRSPGARAGLCTIRVATRST